MMIVDDQVLWDLIGFLCVVIVILVDIKRRGED